MHATIVYPLTLYPTFFGYYFFNGLLMVLQCLHIFWFGLVLRMAIKFLPGNVSIWANNAHPCVQDLIRKEKLCSCCM